MATNDLMSELQKDSIKLDDDSERKVTHVWFINVLDACSKLRVLYFQFFRSSVENG